MALDLEQPIGAIETDARYQAVLLVPLLGRVVQGQVLVATSGYLPPEAIESAIESGLGDTVWRSLARRVIGRAVRGVPPPHDGRKQPDVTVVVESRGDEERLARCLESIESLRTRPAEVTVLRQGGEPHRAVETARGELVAFVDEACDVDPAWLDRLDEAFRDPLVMVVMGYVGPAELDTPAQMLVEQLRGGIERPIAPCTLGGASDEIDPGSKRPAWRALSAGSGANAILRSDFLLEARALIGGRPCVPFASADELLTLYGILDGGYRIALDPSRVAWFHSPREPKRAGRELRRATRAAAAFAAASARRNRDPDGIRTLARLLAGNGPAGTGGLGPAVAGVPGGNRATRAAWALSGLRRSPTPRPLAGRAPSMMRTYAGDADGAPLPEGKGRARGPEQPHLSVIVPSFQRREKLVRMLTALGRQTYPADRFDVTAVIDGSTDGSAAAVRSLDLPYPLQVVEQTREGVAAARNAGARGAGSPLLLFLDDDMIPEPMLLEEHARAHAEGGEDLVVIGYCPSASENGGRWERMLRAWWEDHYRRLTEVDHQWTWIDFSVGNASLPRGLLQRCGGFDEQFRRRNEDQDLGVRLERSRAGFAFRPQARAWHRFETDLAAGLEDVRRQGYYDVLLVRKHPGLLSQVSLGSWLEADGRLRAKPRAAFRVAGVIERLMPPAVSAAALLESLKLRATWYRVTSELRAAAYLLGVNEAISSPRDLGRLSRLEGEKRQSVFARLGADGPIRVSGLGSERELVVVRGDREITRLPLTAFGRLREWDELIEEAAARSVAPLREHLTLEEMLDLARPNGGAVEPAGSAAE